MPDLMQILMRKYSDDYTRAQLRTIASELQAIYARSDAAYEAGDRIAFKEAVAELKSYRPPFSKKTS